MRTRVVLCQSIEPETGYGRETLRGLISFFIRWTGLLCVPGGMLWALSPLGVHLSELKFKTPDLFWKLFPTIS